MSRIASRMWRRLTGRHRLKCVVIDPNVLIAGIGGSGPTGPPALLLGAIRERKIEAVACAALLQEVERGLGKPYFRAQLSEDEADRAIAALARVVLMREDPIEPEAVLRDPEDDYLVALAKAGDAEAIITGDKDLLEHAGLEPQAISPREACKSLGLI